MITKGDLFICAWAYDFLESGKPFAPLTEFRAVLETADPATDVFLTLYGAVDETMTLRHFLDRNWQTPREHDVVSVQPMSKTILRRVPRMFDHPILFRATYGGEQVYYFVVNCMEMPL